MRCAYQAAFWLSWMVGAFGCSPDPTPAPREVPIEAGLDAGTSPVEAGNADGEAGSTVLCNKLSIEGVPASTLVSTPDPAPAPVGGDIENGDYSLFETRVFGVVATPPKEWTTQLLRIMDGQVQVVSNSSTDPNQVSTYSEEWTVGERTLRTRATCPAELPEVARSFSIVTEGGDTFVDVFTRQSNIVTRQRFRRR